MTYHNRFILGYQNGIRQRGISPLPITGMSHVTLLQQIRLWMETRSRGKQYHDRENDSVIESYFDVSPEATLPPEDPEDLRQSEDKPGSHSKKRPT